MGAPDHLALYLSNSCNLACSYCYVSVNQGPAARLTHEDLKKSIDYFLSGVSAPEKKITFLGGEPFLDWALLLKTARYAREKGGRDLVLQTFTNGTLLTPERLEALNELELHVTVSLDGRKGENDKHRRYFKSTERSVFDDVLERLAPLDKSRLGVSLVFTSETIEQFLGNVDYFHRMGFGRITFNPELYETWSPGRLEVMRAALRGLARFYRLQLERGRPFQIPILYSVLQNLESNRKGVKWWHDCHNVVLGPDRKLYACDKALTFPVGQARSHQVGDPAAGGMDWRARAAKFGEAREYIEARGWGDDEVFCPMGVYYHSREAGRDPEAALANFHRVADAFADGLTELVGLCKDLPAFQELYGLARVV